MSKLVQNGLYARENDPWITECSNDNKLQKSNILSLFLTGVADSDHGVITHLKVN